MNKTAIAIRPDDGGQKVVNPNAIDLAHNRYHRAARSSAAMAIVYAAMAGRELLECRKKIKHGGWEKWVEKNCEFNAVTAWRYATIAEQIGDKIQIFNALKISDGKEPHAALLKLLERPPSELLPAETEQLLSDIRRATEGQTLRQLYFDFGLATPPKPTGGANHLHAFLKGNYAAHPEYLEKPLADLPPAVQAHWKKYLEDKEREGLPPGMTMAHHTAKEFWERILGEIHRDLTQFKSYAHLDIAELKDVSENLLDARRKIDDLIKKG